MKRLGLILMALLVLRLVLMAVIPVFESSEARYAAISANMARSGDFVVPRFTYENIYQSFDGKPPLVFQAGGLFCKAFGISRTVDGNPFALQFAVRLFPLLSAILMLAILYHVVRVTSDEERARLAVVVCATCTPFYAAAGLAMTDMTLTCCITGALLLYACLMAGKSRHPMACRMGIAALLGAGMITKGPVALALFGLPVFVDAAVNRRWKMLFDARWLLAAPVFLAVAVPWFVLVEQRNPGAVWYFFYNENFLRFISHDYGDKYGYGREAFRGVSVLWALVATLPWILLPIWNGLRSFMRTRSQPRPVTQTLKHVLIQIREEFPILAAVTITGFWCLTSRVLIYYLFPIIPLFAAALAKKSNPMTLKRLAPWCAGLSALAVTGALLWGMLFTDKMQGAKAKFDTRQNLYANEFYHGAKTPAEIQRLIAERDAKEAAEIAKWLEWRRQREEAARRAKKNTK